MKVLVLTSSFPTHEGGPHSPEFVADLAAHEARQGVEPVILAPHYPGGQFQGNRDAIRVYRFPYFFPFGLERLAYGAGILPNMRKDLFAFASILPFVLAEFCVTAILLWKTRCEIIHTHWLVPQGFIGAFFHRFFGTPHVSTVHGSDLNLLKQTWLSRLLCRAIINNSDIVTVNSTFTKNRLVEIMPRAERKTRIIPMGVDPEKFSTSSYGGQPMGRPAGRIILSVGRLIDWKGTVYLIEALPEVLARIPDACLVIIGTGPEERRLRQRVRDLSLENRVRFLGRVGNAEIGMYYRAAEVFVLPSINSNQNTEALGVVLLEAMVAGCPVIGSNVGGIPDIIRDGETGMLVPERDPTTLANEIVNILSDDMLRERLGRKGCQWVRERFSWDTISRQFSAAYHEATGSGG